jgi:hypothetical protein
LREIAAVQQLPRLPKSRIILSGPGTYIPSKETKLKALGYYLKLIPFLLPPTDSSITSSCLWHTDLHVGNIFVDPNNPSKIVSVIDWQSTDLATLYFQVQQPQVIDYKGPAVTGIERPMIPDTKGLEPEKKLVMADFYDRTMCAIYNNYVYRDTRRIYDALEFQQTDAYTLLLLARNLLLDGEVSYIKQIIDLKETWNELPSSPTQPYAFSFTPEEIWDVERNHEAWKLALETMEPVRDAVGPLFPEDGAITAELYDEALRVLTQVRDAGIKENARDEGERCLDVGVAFWNVVYDGSVQFEVYYEIACAMEFA